MTVVRKVVIGRLHVITDEVLQNRYSHAELARLAITGGADAVQYREKRALLTTDLVTCARAVAQECRAGAAACIVDDRVDVAVAAEADGVHVGRNDLEATIARKLVGNGFLIGGTANSLTEARVVFRTPVDYIGVAHS